MTFRLICHNINFWRKFKKSKLSFNKLRIKWIWSDLQLVNLQACSQMCIQWSLWLWWIHICSQAFRIDQFINHIKFIWFLAYIPEKTHNKLFIPKKLTINSFFYLILEQAFLLDTAMATAANQRAPYKKPMTSSRDSLFVYIRKSLTFFFIFL